jgi:hypothetical protein
MKNAPLSTQPAAPAQAHADAPDAAAETQASDILLNILKSTPFVTRHAQDARTMGGCLIGVCSEDRHPTLVGRVRVQWTTPNGTGDAWLPTLRNLPVRRADQVLLVQPQNGTELIVFGILDGFTRRDTVPDQPAARLELKADEVLRIDDARGRAVLELRVEDTGPIVRLINKGVAIEVDGKLAFRADSIRMEARAGSIEVEASGDVSLAGEVIHLN